MPSTQIQFPGSIIPNAPTDMFAALGKNDQKVHVVPSQNLVLIRMGDAAYANELVPLTLDDDIWYWMNKLLCTQTGIDEASTLQLSAYPNPANNELHIKLPIGNYSIAIYNLAGQQVYEGNTTGNSTIATTALSQGTFILKATNAISGATARLRFSKTM